MAPKRLHNPGAPVSRMAPRAFFDFARAVTVIPRLLSPSLLSAEGIDGRTACRTPMVTLAGSRKRLNSCSASVSQGKGLDLPQAIASALMEAVQGFHAEEGIHITYRELAGDGDAVDPQTLSTRCSTPCARRARLMCSTRFRALRAMIWVKTCGGNSTSCARPVSAGSSP